MRRRTAVLFLLLVFAVPLAWAATAEELIIKAALSIDKKDYAAAVKDLESALKIDPEQAKGHLLLGLTYMQLGRHEKAVEHCLAALKNEPSFAAYNTIGLIYAGQSKYDESVAAFDKALKLSPGAYRAWYQLGLVHASHGDFDKAAEAYKKSVALNPQFPQAYQGLGSAYYWSGNTEAALGQVKELEKNKMPQEAKQLDNWIQKKLTAKKERAPAPAAPATATAQAPAAAPTS